MGPQTIKIYFKTYHFTFKLHSGTGKKIVGNDSDFLVGLIEYKKMH